jgi:Carboxypeptidase regulatory-like domain
MTPLGRLGCLLIATACLVAGALAQVQTSELHVIVKDAKGAVLPGATVTAADPEKGISKSAQTNGGGTAILLSLPPGEYSVTVEAPGFAKLVQSSLPPCRLREPMRPLP